MKKRLLPIALLAVLGVVACNPTTAPTTPEEPSTPSTSVVDPAITSVKITNKDFLHSTWRVGDTTRSLNLVTEEKINVAEALKAGKFTITSSDTSIINVNGKMLYPVKDGYATITVQWKDTNVKDEVRIEVIPAKLTKGSMEIEDFTVGGAYKLGLYQKKLRKAFLVANVENAFTSKEDYKEGLAFNIYDFDKDAGTYKLAVGNKYIAIKETPNADKPGEFTYALELADNAYAWHFDEKLNAFVGEFTHGEGDAAKTTRLVIGANGEKADIKLLDADKLADDETNSVAHVYDFIASANIAKEITSGNKYLLGSADGIYVRDEASKYNIKGSYNSADASEFTVEAATGEGNENKWTLKSNNNKYVGAVVDDGHFNLKLLDDAYPWSYSTKYNNFTTEIDDTMYKIGFKSKYTEWTLFPLKDSVPVASILDPITFADPIGLTVGATTNELTVKGELKMNAVAYPQGAKQVFKWTTSKEGIVEVDENGLVTGLAAGTVKVMATVGSFTKSFELTVLPEPIKNGPVALDTFEVGVPYKMGFYHANTKVAKNLFLNGEADKDNYLTTKEKYEDGATFVINKKGTDTYTIKTGDKYLGLKSVHVDSDKGGYDKYVGGYLTEEFEWKFDAENGVFHAVVKNLSDNTKTLDYFLGTKKDKEFQTASPIQLKDIKYSCPVKVYDYITNPVMLDKAPEAGTYVFGEYSRRLQKTVFMTDEFSGDYIKVTNLPTKAAEVAIAKVGEKYTIKLGEKYLDIVEYEKNGKNNTKYWSSKIVLSETAVEFDYNAEINSLTVKRTHKEDGEDVTNEFMLAQKYDYDTVSAAKVYHAEEKNDYAVMRLHKPSEPISPIALTVTGEKEVKVGGNTQLSVKVYPTGALGPVTWTSSDSTTAKVDADGKVTGLKDGTVTITAKVGDKEATFEMTVTSDPIALPTEISWPNKAWGNNDWTYMGGSEPSYYSGGLKVSNAGVGAKTAIFAPQNKVELTLAIKALNKKGDAAPADATDVFEVKGYNAAGEVIVTVMIKSTDVKAGQSCSAVLEATGICQVSFTMKNFAHCDNKLANINVSSAKVSIPA